MESPERPSHMSLAIHYENLLLAQRELEKEKILLLTLAHEIARLRTKEDILILINSRLKELFPFHSGGIGILDKCKETYTVLLFNEATGTLNDLKSTSLFLDIYPVNKITDVVPCTDSPVLFDIHKLISAGDVPAFINIGYKAGMKEMIKTGLYSEKEILGFFVAFSPVKNAFSEIQLTLLQAICQFLSLALANVLSNEEILERKHEESMLKNENQYLQEKIETTDNFNKIIGANGGLRTVFQLVSNVAATDSTVLLLGETGTGKELIANAIHNSSPRRDKSMIKVNCAALPYHLIESELFGHEKGSFTGATERRIGKFEQANNGTLFLDEIGEMNPELQAKLLRALQEREIERIGGRSVIKTNVRIIAASNRNLKKEVDAGRFRSDLFYRLNVFPIELPALRERMEDIPLLVSHFITKFSQKSGQKIKKVSPRVVRQMMQYSWPGNIRELEHFIERTVLMTSGDIISEAHLLHIEKNSLDASADPHFKSLEENEREYILSALKKSKGRIRGANGAAEILKIPPTTLHSKMKKLGIRKAGS